MIRAALVYTSRWEVLKVMLRKPWRIRLSFCWRKRPEIIRSSFHMPAARP